eukprot:TRINITY_DN104726_c0_g1_i1.p1 TRINITY_DN104726_c0_g1~~TRINITY_DN104726_c0_g1_i1.p1  ORF type:complete len:294 (-),score=53.81 TRINITY_DN104726_c0_g1_i1:183-971(-)
MDDGRDRDGGRDREMRTFYVENEMDFSPWNFVSTNEDGDMIHDGFAIDILRYAGKAGGCNIEFVAEPWRECITTATNAAGKTLPTPWSLGAGLQLGGFDACSASTTVGSRKLGAGFSMEFSQGPDWVVARRPGLGRAPNKVMVINGWAQSALELVKLFPEFNNNDVVEWLGGASDGIAALLARNTEAEAIFINENAARGNGLDIYKSVSGPGIGLMAKKGAPIIGCVNRGLKYMMNDGSYQDICRKWKATQRGANLRCIGDN